MTKVLVFSQAGFNNGLPRWTVKEHEMDNSFVDSLSSIPADNNDFLLCEGKWYQRSAVGNRRVVHILNEELTPQLVPKQLRMRALILT